MIIYTIVCACGFIYLGYSRSQSVSWRFVDILYYPTGMAGVLLLFSTQVDQIARIDAAREMLRIDSAVAHLESEIREINWRIEDKEFEIRGVPKPDDMDVPAAIDYRAPLEEIFRASESWVELNWLRFLAGYLPSPALPLDDCLAQSPDEGCYIVNRRFELLQKEFDFNYSDEVGWTYNPPTEVESFCRLVEITSSAFDESELDRCGGSPAQFVCPVRGLLRDFQNQCRTRDFPFFPTLEPIRTAGEAYTLRISEPNAAISELEMSKRPIQAEIESLHVDRETYDEVFRSPGALEEFGSVKAYAFGIINAYVWPFVLIFALSLKLGKATRDIRRSSLRQ